MGRKARPRVWREWYVTESGGQGIHKLCLVSEGVEKAEEELSLYLDKVKKDRQREKDAGLVQADAPYTVAQLAAELLHLKEATKKAGTADYYAKTLPRLVEWYGHFAAAKITLAQGTDYIVRLKKLDLANTTINHHIQAAKAVFNYAVDEQKLVRNPWRKLDYLPDGKRKRIMTDEEFAKLLQACDKCIAYRGRVSREENRQLIVDILRTLRFTAMRPGELRLLRGDHLHLDEDLIVIPAEEQKTGTTAKDPEDRLIPVLDEVKEMLRTRKERYGSGRLFPNLFGKEWTDQLLSQRFARLRKRAGLDAPDHNGEVLVLYSIRHTHLTECGVKEKWAYPTLQRMSGHARGSRITMRYMHPDRDDVRQAAKEGRQRLAERTGS